MKKINALIILATLLATPFSFAKESPPHPRINELFEELAYSKTNFDPTGAVCEKVAEIELRSVFPESNYRIVNGIEYHNKVEAIGELDIIVFDKKTNNVDTVIEVKCWKSYKNGLRKAREQRMRFQTQLQYDIKIIGKDKTLYPKSQFMNIREYKTVSQLGGMNEGFDFELSLDLKDLMKLRDKLLDCYAHKLCPRVK